MTKKWEIGNAPEFPSDPNGWSQFRQRWHFYFTKFVDAVRRLFLDVRAAEARIDALESAPSGGSGKTLAKVSLRV